MLPISNCAILPWRCRKSCYGTSIASYHRSGLLKALDQSLAVSGAVADSQQKNGAELVARSVPESSTLPLLVEVDQLPKPVLVALEVPSF